MEKTLLMFMKKYSKDKRLCLVEHGLHKVYRDSYKILDQIFDLEIISSDKRKAPGNIKVNFLKELKIFKSWISYKGLYKFLKKKDYDIISVKPYYRPYAFVALLYCILHKKRFIIMEEQRNDPHNLIENIIFRIYLFFLRPLINLKAHKVIALTKPAYGYLKKKGFKKLDLIPTPYSPKIPVREVRNKQKKLKIICVARFEWLKAHHILIRSVSQLIKNNKLTKKDIEVNLVGEGSLMKDMKKLCKKLNVDDVINFKGKVPNDKLDVYYRKHNLFVLSSVSDPIGMVVFEAVSNGLPAIVSSNTGALGAVHEGKNGYIFKSGDYKELAEKILLMKDKNKRQKFGEESIRILKEENGPKVIKERYLTILK